MPPELTSPEPTEPVTSQNAPSGRRYALPVHPLAGVAVVVFIYFASQLLGEVLLSIYPLLQGWSPAHTSNWEANSSLVQFLYILVVEALTVGMLYAFLKHRKLGFKDVGLIRPRLFNFVVSIMAYFPYFILNAFATVGATDLFHLDSGQQQQLGFSTHPSTTGLVLTFISLVILPPLAEEILVRGFLFGSLKKGLPVAMAALVTSLLFATAHLQIGQGAPLLWTAAIDTFILSLTLCYLRQKTGSLWPGIGLHATKNFIAFAVLFLFPHFHSSL